jgi:hypothetical protein
MNIKVLTAAAVIFGALAFVPASAQEVITNPGRCAQFYPNRKSLPRSGQLSIPPRMAGRLRNGPSPQLASPPRLAVNERPASFWLRTAQGNQFAMRPFVRMLSTIVVVALFAIHAAYARTRYQVPKQTASVATSSTKPDAKIPEEMKRDPADIALDRKIKGICRGC